MYSLPMPALSILYTILFFREANVVFFIIPTCHIDEQFEEKSVNFLYSNEYKFSCEYKRWFFSSYVCYM